jgi:hypothetical protein
VHAGRSMAYPEPSNPYGRDHQRYHPSLPSPKSVPLNSTSWPDSVRLRNLSLKLTALIGATTGP